MSFLIGKGAVEVTAIRQEIKTVSLTIHFQCTPSDLAEPETQATIRQISKSAVKYLIDEHFIPKDQDKWLIHVGIVSKE